MTKVNILKFLQCIDCYPNTSTVYKILLTRASTVVSIEKHFPIFRVNISYILLIKQLFL